MNEYMVFSIVASVVAAGFAAWAASLKVECQALNARNGQLEREFLAVSRELDEIRPEDPRVSRFFGVDKDPKDEPRYEVRDGRVKLIMPSDGGEQ